MKMQIEQNHSFLCGVIFIYLKLASCETEMLEADFSSVMPNVTVVAGREARLSCMVQNLGEFKVAWVHYGDFASAVLAVGTHVLTTNRRVTVAAERDTWALVIANATVDDRGEYMCQISTVPPKKMHTTLQVLVPPHINIPPRDVTVDEGQNVTLECQATGDPPPKITWRRENSQLHNAQLSEGENNGPILRLTSVGRTTGGAFLCVASNGVPPAVSARALLSVNYGPVLIGNETLNKRVVMGDEIRLECRFHAYPKPKITWTHFDWEIGDGHKIETKLTSGGETISRLHIRPMNKDDFGLYRCTAENPFGSASAIQNLEERLIPSTTTTTTTTVAPVSISTPVPPAERNLSGESPIAGKTGEVPNGDSSTLLESGIRESKTSAKESVLKNETTKDGSRKLETTFPKRFVQESPHEHLYPIDDTKLFPSSTYSASFVHHQSHYLARVCLLLTSLVSVWCLMSSFHEFIQFSFQ